MQSRKLWPACLQFQQTNACCGRLSKRASSTTPKSADSSPLVSSTNSSTAGGRFPPQKKCAAACWEHAFSPLDHSFHLYAFVTWCCVETRRQFPHGMEVLLNAFACLLPSFAQLTHALEFIGGAFKTGQHASF
ncbi:uncharacterized protein LOC115624645 [Scaptodrosophila lebanonensis]|uniref:Uncharacterized protein LOC115624645 n=1 Tax=Drosophila lebanonensis TaxID=7225 RepID=A0A6J2TIK9_DROLE|nr:uncharacterized protein LOC115624645 [Scaptodrosophila lebanonensis]